MEDLWHFTVLLQFLCVTDQTDYNDYLILIANSCP